MAYLVSPPRRRYSSCPIVVIAASSFGTVFCALHTLRNAILVFVVVTSICQIIGVILLSSFSFTLSIATFVTERSSQRLMLPFHHSMCVRKKVAGTLCTWTFCSLHVFFLCVQSILILMTFQCPFCGVKCTDVPYHGSRAESDCNGSHCKGFTMSIDLWVWSRRSNPIRFC